MKCGTGARTVLNSPKKVMRSGRPNPEMGSSVMNAQGKIKQAVVRSSVISVCTSRAVFLGDGACLFEVLAGFNLPEAGLRSTLIASWSVIEDHSPVPLHTKFYLNSVQSIVAQRDWLHAILTVRYKPQQIVFTAVSRN